MDQIGSATALFEEHRPRLRALAYRMLGSSAEAEDAVQDAWLRWHKSDAVDNPGGWLTTVVARLCLNRLRDRRTDLPLPEPIVTTALSPEDQAALADDIGLALLIVLNSLNPAERLAFVLHDLFDMPFTQIAPLVDRTPAAARQLASRARQRVRSAEIPQPDLGRRRQVVDAFFAATRDGDLAALMRVLHPDVVLYADREPTVVRGATQVSKYARWPRNAVVQPTLVNGSPGALITMNGRPVSVMAFTVTDNQIIQIFGFTHADNLPT